MGSECQCPSGESILIVPEAVTAEVFVCSGVPRTPEYRGCNSDNCADATVCVDNVNGGGLSCNAAIACVYAYELHRVPRPEWACLYADFTSAQTGVIPDVECTEELTTAGLCGRGCGCPEGQICYGNSETHSVGACAPIEPREHYCNPDRSTPCADSVREVCLFPSTLPAWMEALPADAAGRQRTSSGRCIPRARCEALQSAQPGVWSCLDIGT